MARPRAPVSFLLLTLRIERVLKSILAKRFPYAVGPWSWYVVLSLCPTFLTALRDLKGFDLFLNGLVIRVVVTWTWS